MAAYTYVANIHIGLTGLTGLTETGVTRILCHHRRVRECRDFPS